MENLIKQDMFIVFGVVCANMVNVDHSLLHCPIARE